MTKPVEQRVNKAFTAGNPGSASKSVDPDMTGAKNAGATFIDEGGLDGRVIPGDPMLARPSLVESANDLHMRMVEQDLNVAGSAVLGAVVTPVPMSSGGMSADGISFDPGIISGESASSATLDSDSVNAANLRRIEGDLDVTRGTNLDLPEPGDAGPTEY